MDALYFTEEILRFVKDCFPEIERAAIARLVIECRDIIVEIPYGDEYKEYNDYVYDYIKRNRIKVLTDKKLPIKRRISLLPILFGKKFIQFSWKIKNCVKELI